MATNREVELMAKLLWDAAEQWAVDKWQHPRLSWELANEIVQEKYRAMARAVLADRAKPRGRKARADKA